MFLAGGKFRTPGYQTKHLGGSIIRENYHDGLGIIKFFDPKQAGLEAEAAAKGVRLKAVHERTAFDGRLRVGDVVTAIDAEATPDPEKFRRALRRALAGVGTDAAFHVLRDGKAVEVTVRIPPLPAAAAKAPARAKP